MAKTKEWKPRRVRSEDDRGGSSQYITLDDGEKFLGYALFEGDPASDEPGYYEYLEHWVTSPKGHSVPCAGDNCPYCEDGDKPRDRAKSLWLVVKNEKGDELDPPELRIFNLNSIIIKQLTEMRGEGDKIKGRQFRVTRTDDRGNYVLMPKDTSLKASEVKEHLKSKDAPDFDAMVTSSLRKAMEGVATSAALDDDDDDDDKPAKSSKKDKGKASKNSKKKDTEEWPDELDEETVTVVSVEKKGNFFTAKHDDYDGEKDIYTNDDIEFDLKDLNEDDEVEVSATMDSDGDYILSEEPEVEGEPEEKERDEPEAKDDDELPDAVEDEVFEVVSIDAAESTIDMKNDDIEFTLFFLDQGPASEVDFDDYSEGDKVKISAEKDSSGDLVATAIPEVKKDKGGKGGKKGSKKTTAKKGGKKK